MKPLFCFLLVLMISCGSDFPPAENAFDAGREFIEAGLKGDFTKEKAYMLHNEANDKQLDKLKDEYRQRSSDDKVQYSNASINILEEEAPSDSVHIISYRNSYDKVPHKIKVVQTKEGWLVDLASTFNIN